MLIRNDPFRELDRFADQVLGTLARPTPMPMDAWREGDTFTVQLDLPGVDTDKIDIDVDRNVLTVRAERFAKLPHGAEAALAERPWGVFSRQLILGDTLDADKVEAQYDAGVLTLTVPVTQLAKSRKVEVRRPENHDAIVEAEPNPRVEVSQETPQWERQSVDA